MKKSYLFALVATAGLFASCSSDNLADARQNGLDVNENDAAAINLMVTNAMSNGLTRGSGTVGNTTGGEQWAGQKINVFMLDKGTLNVAEDEAHNAIYNNQELTVEAGGGSAVILDITANGTNANWKDRTIETRYFPSAGNYDFWGYRLDDAATGAPTDNGTKKEIAFTIDGSQDVMVGKAEPAAAAIPANDAGAADGQLLSTGNVRGTYGGDPVEVDPARVYSAYSARRNINPQISFKHLLSRFTFQVKGANAACCVDEAEVDPAVIAKAGVKVKAIKVNAKDAGKLVVAYTDADEPERITWNGTTDDFVLKQRAKNVTTPQAGNWFTLNIAYDGTNYTYTFQGTPNAVNKNLGAGATPITDADDVYTTNGVNSNSGIPTGVATTVGTAKAGLASGQDITVYYYVMTTPVAYSNDPLDVDVTGNLQELDPVTPTCNGATMNKVQVGEALMLPAGVNQYTVELTLRQWVTTETTTRVDANGHDIYVNDLTTPTLYYLFVPATDPTPAVCNATVSYADAASYATAKGANGEIEVATQADAEADAATKAIGTYYYRTSGNDAWWSIQVTTGYVAAVPAYWYEVSTPATHIALADWNTGVAAGTYVKWETTVGDFKEQIVHQDIHLPVNPITGQNAAFEPGQSYNVVFTVNGFEATNTTQPTVIPWSPYTGGDLNFGDDTQY